MKARKRFGQNFLVNDHIINSIVDAINPQEGDYLVEIGPGHAALTRPVLERAKALTAVELDRDLAEWLRHDPFLKGLTLIEADALKVDFGTLPGAAEGKLRVFGNLPYNINGRLTVMAQYHAQVIPVLTVPPTAFVPPPKVMSAVVRLKPKGLSPEERALAPYLNKITTTAFSARRKAVRNALAPLFEADELTALNIDLDSRAEMLPLETYVALAQALQAKRSLDEIKDDEDKLQKEKLERRRAKSQHSAEHSAETEGEDTPTKKVRAKKPDKRKEHHKFDDFDYNDINADL